MAGVILAWALAAPLLSVRAGGTPAANALSLQAEAEPKVALAGAPVSLVLTWANRAPSGGRVVRVNRRCLLGREVLLALRDHRGRTLALRTPPDLGPPVETDFQDLAPGRSFRYEYPLVPRDGRALAPGEYRVRAVYRNAVSPPGAEAWTGSLSARASFRVAARAPKRPGK